MVDNTLAKASIFGDQRTRVSEDFAALRRGMAEERAPTAAARNKATRRQIDWPTDDRHEQCPRAWADAASTQLTQDS